MENFPTDGNELWGENDASVRYCEHIRDCQEKAHLDDSVLGTRTGLLSYPCMMAAMLLVRGLDNPTVSEEVR